jgi:hypothetical protein
MDQETLAILVGFAAIYFIADMALYVALTIGK